MLNLAYVSRHEDRLKAFVNAVSEELVGWKAFVDDEVTISDPKPLTNQTFVVVMTIGLPTEDNLHMVFNYDSMFIPREELKQYLREIFD